MWNELNRTERTSKNYEESIKKRLLFIKDTFGCLLFSSVSERTNPFSQIFNAKH